MIIARVFINGVSSLLLYRFTRTVWQDSFVFPVSAISREESGRVNAAIIAVRPMRLRRFVIVSDDFRRTFIGLAFL